MAPQKVFVPSNHLELVRWIRNNQDPSDVASYVKNRARKISLQRHLLGYGTKQENGQFSLSGAFGRKISAALRAEIIYELERDGYLAVGKAGT